MGDPASIAAALISFIQSHQTNYYQLFELSTRGAILTPEEALSVRKLYRRWALIIHPDKCTTQENAEDAFKILSQAYETLTDPEMLQLYCFEFMRSEGPRAPTRGKKTKSPSRPTQRFAKKKKKVPSTTKTANAKEMPRGDEKKDIPSNSKQRTSAEIWQMFKEEEEKFLKEQLKERVGNEAKRKRQRSDHSYNKADDRSPGLFASTGVDGVNGVGRSKNRSEANDDDFVHHVMETDLNEKASEWHAFSGGTHIRSKMPDNRGRNNQASQEDKPDVHASTASSEKGHFCFLCRRKFATEDKLLYHNAMSSLHMRNLYGQKIAEEQLLQHP